jgi:hypothetical protein
MDLPMEAWLLLAAIAGLGIGAMLLTMAAAIRRGVTVIELETRVRILRAQHRQRLIEHGLIEPDEDEIVGVEVIDDGEAIEAVPIDEPAEAGRRAA